MSGKPDKMPVRSCEDLCPFFGEVYLSDGDTPMCFHPITASVADQVGGRVLPLDSERAPSWCELRKRPLLILLEEL